MSTRRVSLLSRDSSEVHTLKQEVEELKRRLEMQQREKQELLEELEDMRSDNEELHRENDVIANEVQDWITEVDSLHKEINHLKKEVLDIQKERDELEDHYYRHKDRYNPRNNSNSSLPVGDCTSTISEASTVLSGNASVASHDDPTSNNNCNSNGESLSSPSAPSTPTSLHHYNAENKHQHQTLMMKNRLQMELEEKSLLKKELDRIKNERDDLIEVLMKANQKNDDLAQRVRQTTYQANHYKWLAREVQIMSEDTSVFLHAMAHLHRQQLLPKKKSTFVSHPSRPQFVPPPDFSMDRYNTYHAGDQEKLIHAIVTDFNNRFVEEPEIPPPPELHDFVLNPPMPPKHEEEAPPLPPENRRARFSLTRPKALATRSASVTSFITSQATPLLQRARQVSAGAIHKKRSQSVVIKKKDDDDIVLLENFKPRRSFIRSWSSPTGFSVKSAPSSRRNSGISSASSILEEGEEDYLDECA